MLRRIIAGSARNPLLVGLATAALILWGGYAAYNMPLDAIMSGFSSSTRTRAVRVFGSRNG
jgi:Cu/Ag efflux pump CusA